MDSGFANAGVIVGMALTMIGVVIGVSDPAVKR
jgi:hypothetical protein